MRIAPFTVGVLLMLMLSSVFVGLTISSGESESVSGVHWPMTVIITGIS